MFFIYQRVKETMPDFLQGTFLHNLLFSDRQVASLCKAFANNPSRYEIIKDSQLLKMIESGGFLGGLLGLLLKVGLPFTKNIGKECVGLTAVVSVVDAGIRQNILGSRTSVSGTILIMQNEELKHIMKIVRSLENSGIMIKAVTQTIESETKERRVDFLVCYWVS